MGFISTIKRWWRMFFPVQSIEKALDITIIYSPEMEHQRELWRNAVAGTNEWNDKAPSQGFASAVSSEFTRVTITDFTFDISDPANPRPEIDDEDWELNPSSMAAFLKAQFEPFVENTAFSEMSNALNDNGELILKPIATPTDGIYIRIIEPDSFGATRYSYKGELLDYIAQETIDRNNTIYTLLEENIYDEINRIFTVRYTAWANNINNGSESLGTSIPLSSVPEWAYLEANNGIQRNNVDKPFVHIKLPLKNDYDKSKRYGVSIFNQAIKAGLIQKIDEHAELTEHELKAGRLKQMASRDLFRITQQRNDINMSAMYRTLDSDLFETVDIDTTGNINNLITTYNPDPRIEPYRIYLNGLLRDLEIKCQLSFGIFSDVGQQDKTATEVLHSKERFYNMNLLIQKTWEDAFKKLLHIMYEIASMESDELASHIEPKPQGEYVVSFSWGDSIMADRTTELQERLQLQTAGVLSAVDNRMWWANESRAKAERNLPGGYEE